MSNAEECQVCKLTMDSAPTPGVIVQDISSDPRDSKVCHGWPVNYMCPVCPLGTIKTFTGPWVVYVGYPKNSKSAE